MEGFYLEDISVGLFLLRERIGLMNKMAVQVISFVLGNHVQLKLVFIVGRDQDVQHVDNLSVLLFRSLEIEFNTNLLKTLRVLMFRITRKHSKCWEQEKPHQKIYIEIYNSNNKTKWRHLKREKPVRLIRVITYWVIATQQNKVKIYWLKNKEDKNLPLKRSWN